MLSQESSHPFFQDDWARALTYRYHPLEEATATQRADPTIVEIIQNAEECIECLCNAMLNVEEVHNKPTSIELEMFKSPRLDKKAVEAACRSVLVSHPPSRARTRRLHCLYCVSFDRLYHIALPSCYSITVSQLANCRKTALIHRCIVGFCGLRTSANPTREDKKLTCKERLSAVISALKVIQVIAYTHRESNASQFDKRICKDVMTEDSKVNFLVHGPLSVTKVYYGASSIIISTHIT